jgi:hypothetical protein
LTFAEEEIASIKIFPGDAAWIALAAGIITYDAIAIFTRKAETMSSAIWRSLAHPVKSPIAAGIWIGVTWHLFANKQAREAYGTYGPHLKKIHQQITNRIG